ncbi:MAG: oligosaccharide repeat unit polymerase [Mesorhizobium sp.]|uniref:O-antigen polymerase n=1 Tax=Mesorhizobium sp. TaxID=1871066 RepID=UPI000FE8A414|nr:O-antigen polymerase [Mesorhizobium sp.]RWP42696.1 MAG: oligosaccharide repeat unit polymerase [Mesorhizobium sp.]
MAIVTIVSSVHRPKKGQISLGIYIILSVQYVWCVVGCLIYAFNLEPVTVSYIRSVYFQDENLRTAIFCSLQLLFVMCALAAVKDADLVRNNKLTNLYRSILMAGIVVASIACNQSGTIFEGGYGQEGFNTSRWGGWPLIFVVLCSAFILLDRMRGAISVIFINVIVAYWLIHGNRSEVLILFIFANMLFLMSRFGFNFSSPRNIILGGLVVFGAFIAFEFIGSVRSQGLSHGAAILSPGKMSQEGSIRISTIGSSVYSHVAAIGVMQNENYLLGLSYLYQLTNLIPSFVPVPWDRGEDVVSIVRDADVMGGIGVTGEAYVNFGIIGPPLFAALMAMVFGRVAQASVESKWAASFFVALVLYSTRFFFYGYVYLFKTIMFFIFLFVMLRLLEQLGIVRPARAVSQGQR